MPNDQLWFVQIQKGDNNNNIHNNNNNIKFIGEEELVHHEMPEQLKCSLS